MKTVGFKAPKYVGDPINAVKIFNEKEADELIVLDIDATSQGSEPNYKLIAQLAVECRMPLCYGGGVKTADHARRIVGLGVEKVAISSGAIENPQIISSIAGAIGNQSVVVILDVARAASGEGYEVWTHNGRRKTGKLVHELALKMEELGAGELVVNSIDQDGSMTGYDLNLALSLRRVTRLPMTVLGGAGSLADIRELIIGCGVVGAAAGSLFVFKGPYRAVLINYPGYEEKKAILGIAPDRPGSAVLSRDEQPCQ